MNDWPPSRPGFFILGSAPEPVGALSKQKNLLRLQLPGTKPQFLGYTVGSLVSLPTELSTITE